MAFPDDELDVLVEAFLGADPTADPGTWPSATDLSARLLDEPITITRGRASGQSTLSSGSCTFVLNNDEIGDGTGANAAGVLTPLLATSPYYGTWDLGVPVRLSVTGVGSSPPYRRFSGFVASIEATVIPIVGGGTHSAVRVTLGGKVRQMSQGSVPIGANARTILATDPFAYWGLHDGERAEAGVLTAGDGGEFTTIVIPNIGTVGQVASGEAEVAPWLGTGISLSERGAAGASVVLTSLTRLTVDAAVLWTPSADNESIVLEVYGDISAGLLGSRMELEISSDDLDAGQFLYFTGGNFEGGSDFETGAASFDPEVVHHLRLDLQDDGADLDYTGYLDGVLLATGTYPGVNLDDFGFNIVVVRQANDVGTTPVSAWCDIALYADVTPPDVEVAARAVQGYDGEQAHDRIERVCAEEGIPYSSAATFGQACGPQPIADALGVLRDAEAVDHGMLTELRDTWGFGYVSSDERYNQAAALTIDLSTYRVTQGDSATVLVPSRNDRRVRNEWTVTRQAGSEATVVDTDHQGKHGRYNDAVTVNLYLDDQAMHDAGWRVHEGTVDGLRYGTIPLDIGANASALLQDWLDLDLGARVDRTNHPSPPHPHDDIAVMVEGYAETTRRKAWKANLVTEPYEPWNVRELNEDTDPDSNVFAGRWAEEEGTVLDEAINTTDTSFDVDVAGGAWTQDADEFDTDLGVGLFIEVGGEVMQVTNIAESGGTWTFTVVRSVNGVVRAHDAGTPLQVVDAMIWAL